MDAALNRDAQLMRTAQLLRAEGQTGRLTVEGSPCGGWIHYQRQRRAVTVAAVPVATIKASLRTGHAVVTIERQGRAPRRHKVSLKRYAAIRECTLTKLAEIYKTSGSWMRHGIEVYIWGFR